MLILIYSKVNTQHFEEFQKIYFPPYFPQVLFQLKGNTDFWMKLILP